MDPNANLREQRELARLILSGNPSARYADRLAELVVALDSWIRAGGFMPADWELS